MLTLNGFRVYIVHCWQLAGFTLYFVLFSYKHQPNPDLYYLRFLLAVKRSNNKKRNFRNSHRFVAWRRRVAPFCKPTRNVHREHWTLKKIRRKVKELRSAIVHLNFSSTICQAKNFSAIYSAVCAWGYYKRLMAQYNVISAYFSHKSRLERPKLATPLMAMIIMMMMTMFRTKIEKNLSSQNGHNTIKTLLKATYFNGSARESRGKSIEW